MAILKLKAGKLEVKNKAEDKVELTIFGEITSSKWDENDTEPQDIKFLLNEIGDKDIDIYINSPGGSVFAGIAIYNMLKRHTGYKKVIVEGYAASIASVIAMAGDEIIIPANAYLMIHKAWGVVIGNADELRKKVDLYERLDTSIANAYLSKATEGMTEEKFLELMKNETWLNGKEAVKYFNVTLDEENQVAACLDGKLYKNYKLPKDLKMKNKPIEKPKDIEEEIAKAKLSLLLEI